MEIDFAGIEKKWQKAWEDSKAFEVSENSKKSPYYVLEMFPYPSGSGLHMGHAWNYTIGDIIARFKRMKGFNVMHPMGFDSLGLPAENAAIQAGKHPDDYTNESIPNFIRQMKEIGLSYDWSRTLSSHEPSYYKWDQWIFLKMLEKGLAYQKTSAVNWCRKCNTVLANEQVHDGKCWRHDDTEVEVRQLKQWFLKTTEYADELYENLDNMDWPDRTKAMQKNWIGKSHGTEIDFSISIDGDIKDKEFVFLHAYQDNSKSVFWPRLKKEIESRGGNVAYAPDLPNSSEPNIDEQVEFVLKNYEFKDNTVLVTHSLGAVLAMKLLPKIKVKIKKLILIAPPSSLKFRDGKKRPILEKCCDWKFDYDAVKEKVENISVLSDKNDHILREESAVEVAKKLSANYQMVVGEETHFNGTMEPEIEKVIFGKWPVFTTRPDTIFGVTFLVVAAQHPKLDSLVTSDQRKDVDKFLKKLKSVSEKDVGDLEKEGVFTGSYAINPANGEKVPVYAGNFVVADYGSGMVMAVPAHDQRDFEFARKYNIEVKQVVGPIYGDPHKDAVHRNTISVVVHRKSDDKFLALKWKKFDWISPVIGGIEEGESVEEAAIREVLEETGYKTKFVRKLGEVVESHFYAEHKKIWRSRLNQPVLLELVEDKPCEVDCEEKDRHDAIWLSADEIFEKVTHKENCDGLLVYLGKDVAYTGSGNLVNSGEFDGLENTRAKHNITEWLIKNGNGRRVTNFKLRDWGISRQRYWGTPIPVIHCEKCGAVPVPEKDLPVVLPHDVKFGDGNPLETNEAWLSVDCPKCSGKGRRESDTMDTFANSSWYFMRYCDSKNDKKIFDPKKVKYWCPVDTYVGGAEHACMHLIYSRFYTKFLRDLGLIDFDEPAKRLFHQGMLGGEGGVKMSKSKPETCVLPEDVSNKYGMDTARFFLSSLASPDKNIDWSEKGIVGSSRFIKKIFDFFDENFAGSKSQVAGSDSDELLSKLNKTIKNVEGYYDNFEYRKATIEIRELFDVIEKFGNGKLVMGDGVSKDSAGKFLQLLSPVCPHITEELWERLHKLTAHGSRLTANKFISVSKWPEVDDKKILKKGQTGGDLNGKIIDRVKGILKDDTKTVYVYVMPFELDKVYSAKIGKGVGKDVKVFAVNDKDKVDPKGMAKRAKPGMAAIYLE